MPDVIDFPPVFTESAETIRARILADINTSLVRPTPASSTPPPAALPPTCSAASCWNSSGCGTPSARRWWPPAWSPTLGRLPRRPGRGARRRAQGRRLRLRRGAGRHRGLVVAVGAEVAVPGTVEEEPDAEPITFRATAAAVVSALGFVELAVDHRRGGSAGCVRAGRLISVPNSSIGGRHQPAGHRRRRRRRVRRAAAPAHPARPLPAAPGPARPRAVGAGRPGVGHVTVEPLFAARGPRG